MTAWVCKSEASWKNVVGNEKKGKKKNDEARSRKHSLRPASTKTRTITMCVCVFFFFSLYRRQERKKTSKEGEGGRRERVALQTFIKEKRWITSGHARWQRRFSGAYLRSFFIKTMYKKKKRENFPSFSPFSMTTRHKNCVGSSQRPQERKTKKKKRPTHRHRHYWVIFLLPLRVQRLIFFLFKGAMYVVNC